MNLASRMASATGEQREQSFEISNWRVKCFDASSTTNGKYMVVSATCGATKLESTGKWVGGMRLRLMIPSLMYESCPDAPSDVYMVDGHISWKPTEMPDGRIFTTPSLWVDSIAPYFPKPKTEEAKSSELTDDEGLVEVKSVDEILGTFELEDEAEVLD